MNAFENMEHEKMNISVLTQSIYETWDNDNILLYSLCDEDIKEFMNDYDTIKNLLITKTNEFMSGKDVSDSSLCHLEIVYNRLQEIYMETCYQSEENPEYSWNKSMFAIME